MSNEDVRNEAYKYYKSGMKYREIAEKCGVSLSAVKSWASRYWKKGGCNQSNKKSQPEKKKVATGGAPKGNKNAAGNKGGAAPQGNKNAVTTGEFETLLFECLDEDEKKLAQTVPDDKMALLLQEIRLATIREQRMLRRIESVRNSVEYLEDGTLVEGMTSVKLQSGTEKGKMTDLREYQGKLGQIQSIEEALTRVQARKQKMIEVLHRFGFDDARLELEIMKVELASMKLGSQETEVMDDGFMDALNAESGVLWKSADGNERQDSFAEKES